MNDLNLNVAERLAKFFQDYGAYAALALMLLAIIYLYRAQQKEAKAKFELALKLAPLAERMLLLLERAAQARARRGSQPPRPSLLSGREPDKDD